MPLLVEKGYAVTGCDINLYEGTAWEEVMQPHEELIQDIRDLSVDELRGHDTVMHLAALSNDPMGDVDPQLTYQINLEGSVRLAELAKEAGHSSTEAGHRGQRPVVHRDALILTV